jgi:5'(3')-deoxyribonucleotidase
MPILSPTVLLDVDGVLADMVTPSLERIAQLGGPVVHHDELLTWEIFDTFDVKYKKHVHAMWHERGFCGSLEPYEGSQAAVKRLREIADVVCVTAATPSGWWHQERVEWLEKLYGIPSSAVIFAYRKELVRGDVFVEDKARTLFDWAACNPVGQGVLWERSYNRQVEPPSGVVKTLDWDLVIGLVHLGAGDIAWT